MFGDKRCNEFVVADGNAGAWAVDGRDADAQRQVSLCRERVYELVAAVAAVVTPRLPEPSRRLRFDEGERDHEL